MNSTVAEPRDTVPSRPSILAHPWFAKVIALWFAALFGLCSLAVAPDLLERVVTMLGIDRVVPAAAPPLGRTAQLLLAMGMAGVGEIVGLVIGGRLAASRRAQSRPQRGVEPAEPNDAGPDTASQVRGRDRHADAPPRKPLSAIDELSGIDQALRHRASASDADPEPRPLCDVAPPPAAHADGEAEPVVAAQDPQAADPVAWEDLDPAMDGASSGPAAPPIAAPGPMVAEVAEPVAAPLTAPAGEIASASLDALGVVHLSERLALALQAHRVRRAQHVSTAAMAAPDASLPEEISPGVQPGLEILARRAPKADPEAGTIANLGRERALVPTPEEDVDAFADDADDVADETAEGDYSSLLAMGSSLARPGPAAVADFAGSPPPQPPAATRTTPPVDPEETDRALRAARASPERISGVR